MRIFATLLCLLALIVPALAQSNYAVLPEPSRIRSLFRSSELRFTSRP